MIRTLGITDELKYQTLNLPKQLTKVQLSNSLSLRGTTMLYNDLQRKQLF